MRVMDILKFRRLLPCKNAKSKSHSAPASSHAPPPNRALKRTRVVLLASELGFPARAA
jgi:hypothetical protein